MNNKFAFNQLAFLVLAFLAFQSGHADLTEIRTWSDQKGRQIEARLLTYDSTLRTGTFRREDGYVVHIPIKMLAADDQAFVSKLLAAKESEQMPLNQTATEEENQSEHYVFSNLAKKKTDGFINTKEGWEHEIDALRARVRYRAESPPAGRQYVKAYFYDRDRKLIQSYGNPARIQGQDGEYEDPPIAFEFNANEEVYFPISAYLEQRDWQRCIVVFGDDKEAYARIYPSGDLSEYRFPERTLIFGEDLKQLSNGQTERERTEYHVNSARKSRFNATAWVDGAWMDGAEGLLVEVEVDNSLPAPGYFLKAHFFDRNNRRLMTVDRPTQIESDDDANAYTSLPKFAKTDDEMVAFFPFDEKLEALDWRKAVVVFGDRDKVDLAIVGGDSSDLDLLEFPEKALYPELAE